MTASAKKVRALFLAGQPHSITARPLSDDDLARLLERMNERFGDGEPGWKEVPLPPGAHYEWDDAAKAWVHAPPEQPEVTEAMVRAEAARCLEDMASSYTAEERETWYVQIAEAKALKADPAAAAPLLGQLAAEDGMTAEQFADHVLAKALTKATKSGAILAAQRRLIAMEPIPQDYATQLAAAASSPAP